MNHAKSSIQNYATHPSEEKLNETRNVLKPPGTLSNNYNIHGLKKVERSFIPAKDITSFTVTERMSQTNCSLNQPPKMNEEQNNYFNTTNKRQSSGVYDRINHVKEGYNQILHREDRTHAKSRGLHLHEEECERTIPVTSNAIYGKPNRLLMEKHPKNYGHVDICEHDFKRVSGVNIN